MVAIIYKVTNKKHNNKVYIGQTIQLFEDRKKSHIQKAFQEKSNIYFHNALRKYGLNSFKWEIIDKANNIEELNILEKYYIKRYKSNNKKYGYNLTSGGLNYIRNESTKQKISQIQKGRKLSKTTRQKISKGLRKSNHPLHGLKGEQHPLYNVPRPPQIRKQIGKSQNKRGLFGLTGCRYSNKSTNPWKRVWQAHIQYNRKYISLGYFEDMLSAQIVRNLVEKEIWK